MSDVTVNSRLLGLKEVDMRFVFHALDVSAPRESSTEANVAHGVAADVA